MDNPNVFSINLVSPAVRGINAAIAAIVLAAQALFAGEQGVSVAGLAILLIAIVGALIEERWIFDLERETARFRFGLLFAAHTRTIPFSAISAIEFDDFEKGFNRQKWTRIVIRVPGGKDEILDTVNRNKARALIARAERLAAFFAAREKG